MEEELRVAVVSIYSIPNGGAATNRILAYTKGLVENGAEVDVFAIFPTENHQPVKELLPKSGVYHNIRYSYTSGRYRSRYKIIRAISKISRFRHLYGYYTSYKQIRKQSKKCDYDALIISTDMIPALATFSHLANTICAKSIFIFDEFPTPIRHKLKTSIPIWKEILYKIVLKKIDAYISISNELKNYYCGLSQKPTFVLPVIVDISKFIPSSSRNSTPRKYLCYMGNMELSKDDVDNIIKSFHLVCDDFPDLELHLYGNPVPETMNTLTRLIDVLGLKDRVFLKGRVSNELVPEIIQNAYVLVSSQPDTKRASGGFPTKLGEYLSTGIPTLITDVGENAKYVNDKEHVFFAKPKNPEDYANCLNFILNNYKDALKVARNGQTFVYENYSHVIQGKRLIEFISTL